ncbi:MAG: hypothetical protein PHW10_05010 [Candidatus Peribacteraceae bacterium]|nr:hypothetical protein [Candidatus Peribacteraceae bacterium]
MHTHTRPRSVFRWKADVPALHAGALVVAAIVAALCNAGVFLLLLAARVAYVGARGGTKRGMRSVLPDLLLLVFVLDVAVLVPHRPAALDGMSLALWTFLIGAADVLPKYLVMHRTIRSFSPENTHDTKAHTSSKDTVMLFLLFTGLLLLFLSPALTTGWLSVLRRQLIPWRF